MFNGDREADQRDKTAVAVASYALGKVLFGFGSHADHTTVRFGLTDFGKPAAGRSIDRPADRLPLAYVVGEQANRREKESETTSTHGERS